MAVHPEEIEEAADEHAAGEDFTRDRFDWIDQVVSDRELPPLALHVAMVLMKHFNRRSREAFPHQKTIAEKLKASRNWVGNALVQLAAAGHIDIISPSGRKTGNRYRMVLRSRGSTSSHANSSGHEPHFHAKPNGHETQPYANSSGHEDQAHANSSGHKDRFHANSSVHLMPSGVGTNNTVKELSEREIYTPPQASGGEGGSSPRPSASDADFAEFWAQVPLQREEGETRRAYDKAIVGGKATHKQLMVGIARYAAERHGQDPRFTKHPANWISKGCWNDAQHAPTILLPINGGLHQGAPNGHASSRSRSGGMSAAAGIAAAAAKHRRTDR